MPMENPYRAARDTYSADGERLGVLRLTFTARSRLDPVAGFVITA